MKKKKKNRIRYMFMHVIKQPPLQKNKMNRTYTRKLKYIGEAEDEEKKKILFSCKQKKNLPNGLANEPNTPCTILKFVQPVPYPHILISTIISFSHFFLLLPLPFFSSCLFFIVVKNLNLMPSVGKRETQRGSVL